MRVLCLLWLVACAKPPPAPAFSWADTPRLPSPSAGTYGRGSTAPTDPPMAALVAGKRWDAYLSGAAAGLAIKLLDAPSVPGWQVRHQAWRAGYPYPVDTMSVWRTAAGDSPPHELMDWLGRRTDQEDIGLVRARDPDGDTWVAITGAPRAALGVQPRQLPVGATFTLPAVPGATFAIADSRGELRSGALELPQTFTADIPGEWLVKVQDAQGVLARFPIYVAITPPTDPIVGVEIPGTPDEQVRGLLDEIRATHGLPPYTSDLLFESAARRDLEGNDSSKDELAGRLGWDPERLARWDVRAGSVAEALDRVIWEPGSRPALLAQVASYGVAATTDDKGVRVVVFVGFE